MGNAFGGLVARNALACGFYAFLNHLWDVGMRLSFESWCFSCEVLLFEVGIIRGPMKGGGLTRGDVENSGSCQSTSRTSILRDMVTVFGKFEAVRDFES
jgi:hypothetical protein